MPKPARGRHQPVALVSQLVVLAQMRLHQRVEQRAERRRVGVVHEQRATLKHARVREVQVLARVCHLMAAINVEEPRRNFRR